MPAVRIWGRGRERFYEPSFYHMAYVNKLLRGEMKDWPVEFERKNFTRIAENGDVHLR
jgi:hypothetical protein